MIHISKKILSLLIIGLIFFPYVAQAQRFKLKKDSVYINNYQIEITTKKKYIFISDNGFVDIPMDSIRNINKVDIIDFNDNKAYNLYGEELKIKNDELYFSVGKLIQPVILGNKKESIIGIDAKGGSSKLYIRTNSSKIVEIPDINKYESRKIKKIRYYFTGGNNTIYNIKTNKNNIRIIPILYTCQSVDCIDKKNLIPEMEIQFLENTKFLEVDLSQQNIFIDEVFKNLYIGYIALNYFVVKEKNVEKIGINKCYNYFPELNVSRLSTNKCPIISVVIE